MKKLKALALVSIVLVILILALVSCDGNDHTHTFSDATCTAPKTCECGATEGEALGHTVVTDAAVAPTCTEGGLTEGSHCSVCEKVLTEQTEVAAKGHSYESVVTAPTCTEGGYTTYTCACGDTYVADETAAKGHSYESVVTAPTCTEGGYTTYTCACGDTYVADETTAKGHSYESVVTAPTCTEGGYTTYTCACGDTYVADETAAKGHAFIDGKCVCGLEYVEEEPTGDWALVTELKNGDHVLIGAPAHGKLLSATKTGFYNVGVNYSADNFANVTDAEIFVVTVNDDGSYTFTSLTGDVIALGSSYSSLNVDGEHKSWTLTDKGDGTFLVFNTGRKTYLEWYSSKNNWSTYTAGNTDEYFLSFYARSAGTSEDHVHNHITEVVAPTCEADGYTSYTCACGDSYKANEVAATGHSYESVVTAPTCTEDGYTTYTCSSCGAEKTDDVTPATGHTYVEGYCACGAADPDNHPSHRYTEVVTAPTCTADGYTTYTCVCGDSYVGNTVPAVGHVDANLDITCDFDGCSKRILPAADSKVSLFTANHMIIVSLNSSYYVEGVVTEITDAKNGIFIIADEAGDTILVRLPKNSDGTLYSSWTTKVVVGDTVQVYGKPTKNTGAPTTQAAKVEGGVLTVLAHEHNFSEATCADAAECACGAIGDAALGHVDETGDKLCDRCGWNMNLQTSYITVATDPSANGVLDEDKTKWVWSGTDFSVEIAKGTSTFTLYTNAKAYMQLKKQNTLTVYNTTGAKIETVTIYTTNATQLGNLEKALANQNLTFTKNDADLCITIEVGASGDFTITNNGTTTAYVSGVEVVYAPAEAAE